MAKVRLSACVLAFVAALWVVAEGLAPAPFMGNPSARSLTTLPDASLSDGAPSALEQLDAHDHVVFLLGRCSAEMTWRHRRDGALDACIGHAR